MTRSKIAMRFLWAVLGVALHVWPMAHGAHAQAPNALRAQPRPWLRALLLVFLFSLAGAGRVAGQGSRKDDIVFNSRGVPLAGATVRVCVMPASGQPCTPLAQIFSDAALTQALANPTTTDGMGNYFFYAAPGKYEIEFSGPGIITKQIPNVILPSDPTSPSFSSVTSSGAISAFSLNLTGNLTVNGNTTVVGNLASNSLNNIKYLDGNKYALTDAGLSNAMTDAGNGGTVVIPPNTTVALAGTVTCTAGMGNLTIAGSGMGSVLQVNHTADVFAQNCTGFRLMNLQVLINTSSTRAGSNVINQGARQTTVEEVYFTGNGSSPNNGRIFFSSGNNQIGQGLIWLRDVFFQTGTWQNVLLVQASSSSFSIDNIKGFNIQQNGVVTFTDGGIVLDGFIDTAVFEHINIAATSNPPMIIRNTVAPAGEYPRWVRCTDCFLEGGSNTANTDLLITSGRDIQYNNGYFATVATGVSLSGATGVEIKGNVFVNLGQSAITYAGSGQLLIADNDFQDTCNQTTNTYDTISVTAVANLQVSGNYWRNVSSNKCRYGVNLPSGENQATIENNQYSAATFGTGFLNIPSPGPNVNVFGQDSTVTARIPGPLLTALAIANQGAACANGDLTFSASFGSTTAASAVTGTGQSCHWTITSSGAGQAANPTITWTLKTALPSSATTCEMRMDGGTGGNTLINQTTQSSTAPVFTFSGTPAAGSTYFVLARCGP